MITLLLLTQPANSPIAWHALKLTQCLIEQQQAVRVFFYQDAVTIANKIAWQPEDLSNLSAEWQNLNIDLPVCVSAALYRGITDEENAKRHQRDQSNLLSGFRLAGLGELADAMLAATRTLQF